MACEQRCGHAMGFICLVFQPRVLRPFTKGHDCVPMCCLTNSALLLLDLRAYVLSASSTLKQTRDGTTRKFFILFLRAYVPTVNNKRGRGRVGWVRGWHAQSVYWLSGLICLTTG
jgi:hypothetical protein